MLEDRGHVGLRQDMESPTLDVQPLCPELDLLDGLLSRNVEDRSQVSSQGPAYLQQESGFSHSGITSHQHQGTPYEAPAKHPVELAQSQFYPGKVLQSHIGELLRNPWARGEPGGFFPFRASCDLC